MFKIHKMTLDIDHKMLKINPIIIFLREIKMQIKKMTNILININQIISIEEKTTILE
jgi:hypothetical protein